MTERAQTIGTHQKQLQTHQKQLQTHTYQPIAGGQLKSRILAIAQDKQYVANLTLDSRWPYLQKYVMLWFDGMYDAPSSLTTDDDDSSSRKYKQQLCLFTPVQVS